MAPPADRPPDRLWEREGEAAETPAGLERRLEALLEAECVAELRGYDLVARLYAAEWQTLFQRYTKALEPARKRWLQILDDELPEEGRWFLQSDI